MNALQFKTALAGAGMSQSELSRQLQTSINTVNRWASAGVPDNRVQAVAAALKAATPKEKRPEEMRIFRSLDGATEMRYKDVLKLPHGTMFWEYAHAGHPAPEPVLRRAVPCWIINQRKLWGQGLMGVRTAEELKHPMNRPNIELPADTTLEQFKAFAALQNDKDRQAAARVALAHAQYPDTDPANYSEEIDDFNEPGYLDKPSPFRTL